MKRARTPSRREPTIALINIVFLMLIFFMVVGTLAPQLAEDFAAIETTQLECCVPPDTLFVRADGTIIHDGQPASTFEHYLAQLDPNEPVARILPDAHLPALELLSLIDSLHAEGAERVIVLTEHQPR